MSAFLRLLTPTRLQAEVYLSLSLLFLSVINLSAITSLFVSSEVFQHGSNAAVENLKSFTRLIDNLSFTNTLALAFFWALFGTVLYIIGWTIYELGLETRHDAREATDHNLHYPTYIKHSSFMLTVLARSMVRALACILIPAHALLMIGFVVPFASQLVHDIGAVDENFIVIINLPAGVLLLACGLHVFTVLLRLLFLRARLSGRLEY
jgi:hypothetical protein